MTAAGPRIAIIIDDIGYNQKLDEQVIKLPARITCSVIAKSPHAHRLGFAAYRYGKQVMIHLPMPTQDGRKLDPGSIDASMSQTEIGTVIDQALAILPEARGVNNHMGSALTARKDSMARLMQALRQRHLFFVDSRTTAMTVAERMARQAGVSTGRRDIFLDDQRTASSINRQFDKLLHLARQRGQAIAVGHPYPETIRYLQQALPALEDTDIKVVPVSELLSRPRHPVIDTTPPPPPDDLTHPLSTGPG